MNKLQYSTRVYTPEGDSVPLSVLRKRILAGEKVSILGQYPNAVIAPARVKSIESSNEPQLWHLKVSDSKAIHCSAETELASGSKFVTLSDIIPKTSVLNLGPTAFDARGAIRMALAGSLRHEHKPEEKAPYWFGTVTKLVKSGYTFAGENRTMSVTMEEAGAFVITSGIIVKSNGDNN